MAETPWSKFRLSADALADLDALAASNGGVRAVALREAIGQFRALVQSAGQENAAELSEADWERLAHLNDPDPFGGLDIEPDSHTRDWSQHLAAELVGAWEGRDTTRPLHAEEAEECRDLAALVASWGPLRGYALMCALRYFWRSPDAGIVACVAPEIWLTPMAGKRGE